MHPVTDYSSPGGLAVVRSLRWEDDALYILDQGRLPGEVVEEKQESAEQVWESIRRLKVRGAPAIGIAGSYGLLVGLKPFRHLDPGAFLERAEATASYLKTSRPTAVNLGWALDRMLAFARANAAAATSADATALFDMLVVEARRIHAEDRMICRGIGESGEALIKEGCGVLTHCNAGALAASELGTATAPMYFAFRRGRRFRIYADETRPLLQGARLTAWELVHAGICAVLITDNMAAQVMREGRVEMVIVGADRIAANGDTANKIGTYGVAILAARHKIPFYVAAPYSTFDLSLESGADIPIELRGSAEITEGFGRRTAPENVRTYSPAFDVTPADLIAGIITERGIIQPVCKENVVKLMR